MATRRGWQVRLLKPLPNANQYRADYFPRKFYYKADALSLLKEVKEQGGEAVVEREPVPEMLTKSKNAPRWVEEKNDGTIYDQSDD